MTYRVLREAGGHLSVDDIWQGLNRHGWSITRMTIYNVVSDLERAGLVMLADAGPGRALYEASETWHHHFVCRKCGVVLDVPCVIGEKPCLDADFDDGEVDEAQVIFRGVCKKCLLDKGGEASGAAN